MELSTVRERIMYGDNVQDMLVFERRLHTTRMLEVLKTGSCQYQVCYARRSEWKTLTGDEYAHDMAHWPQSVGIRYTKLKCESERT